MTTTRATCAATVRLPRILATRPDAAATREQARIAVNLLRWRATLAQLVVDYDVAHADTVLNPGERQDRLDRLLGEINTVVDVDPAQAGALDLPVSGPLRVVRIAEQVLEGLILAANHCGRRDTSVETAVRRWMRAPEFDTAIAVADGRGTRIARGDAGTEPLRDAVLRLLELWLREPSMATQ